MGFVLTNQISGKRNRTWQTQNVSQKILIATRKKGVLLRITKTVRRESIQSTYHFTLT